MLALEVKAGLVPPEEVTMEIPDQVWPEEIEQAKDRWIIAAQERPDLVAGYLERIAYAVEWLDIKMRQDDR